MKEIYFEEHVLFWDKNAFLTISPAGLRHSTTADSCSKGLKPFLCTIREAQGFFCKTEIQVRTIGEGLLARLLHNILLYNSTNLSENLFFCPPSKESFDCWGNHFLSRQESILKRRPALCVSLCRGSWKMHGYESVTANIQTMCRRAHVSA